MNIKNKIILIILFFQLKQNTCFIVGLLKFISVNNSCQTSKDYFREGIEYADRDYSHPDESNKLNELNKQLEYESKDSQKIIIINNFLNNKTDKIDNNMNYYQS